MRLDESDDSINVEDQRGGGGSSGGGGLFGGGGGGLPFALLTMIGSRFGIGGVIVVVIGMALFGGLGNLVGGGQQTAVSPQGGGNSAAESCSVNGFSRESCNALASLNKTWAPMFEKAGGNFTAPKLVFYAQSGNSGCGAAQSAMGPFYCPPDQGIYIDTDFYTEMDKQMGAGGDFARAYVMAHEYGHHIQNLTGLSAKVQSAQQSNPSRANQMSVKLELQADCYAGVWASLNKDRIEPGDIEEGLTAAHQIGDDALMKAAGRRPVEAAFTHGSSEQRMQWLRKGLDTGDPGQCDTFANS